MLRWKVQQTNNICNLQVLQDEVDPPSKLIYWRHLLEKLQCSRSKRKTNMASSAGERGDKSAGVFHKSLQGTFDSYIVEIISDFSQVYIRIRCSKYKMKNSLWIKLQYLFTKLKWIMYHLLLLLSIIYLFSCNFCILLLLTSRLQTEEYTDWNRNGKLHINVKIIILFLTSSWPLAQLFHLPLTLFTFLTTKYFFLLLYFIHVCFC